MAIIGIPRALAYYAFFPFWKTFFEELGQNVVLSTPTTRSILDQGVKEAVNDACIPIKIYHGHVAQLAAQGVDYIFSPRLVSVRRFGDFGTETFCPKFLGLPDMIRTAFDELPPIIDTRIDIKKDNNALLDACLEVGDMLGAPRYISKKAFREASWIQRKYQELLLDGFFPQEAMQVLDGKKITPENNSSADLNIAVLGYPYAIYDPYVNVELIKKLHEQGVRIYTQDMLSDKVLDKQISNLPKSMFWYFSNRTMYGGLHYMEKGNVDGIIHVTAFACGPDSLVDRLLEIESHKHNMPYLSITVDEHTGEAGVRTRIEAFLDMLRFRRGKL